MAYSVVLYKLVLRNDFEKSAKERGLSIDTDVARYWDHDASIKVMCSVINSRAGATDPDEFQRHFHVVDLTRTSGADHILI